MVPVCLLHDPGIFFFSLFAASIAAHHRNRLYSGYKVPWSLRTYQEGYRMPPTTKVETTHSKLTNCGIFNRSTQTSQSHTHSLGYPSIRNRSAKPLGQRQDFSITVPPKTTSPPKKIIFSGQGVTSSFLQGPFIFSKNYSLDNIAQKDIKGPFPSHKARTFYSTLLPRLVPSYSEPYPHPTSKPTLTPTRLKGCKQNVHLLYR